LQTRYLLFLASTAKGFVLTVKTKTKKQKSNGNAESHGAFTANALSFLTALGERLTGTSSDLREMSYLFQTLSVISVSIRPQYTSALFPPLKIRTFSHSNFCFLLHVLAICIFTMEDEKHFK